MTQVLSPIISQASSMMSRLNGPIGDLTLSTGPFSPVNENGTFMMDQIYKEGWLWKRTRTTKAWKRRWFILRASVIGIYKDQKEAKLYRQIGLEDLTACAMLQGSKRPNVIGLFSPSKNYQLQADSAKDAQQWLELIRKNARIEETEEEFLMSPTAEQATNPMAIPTSPVNKDMASSPPPKNDGFMSSHTLDYSGTSMSSTSELGGIGGMISQSSLASPPNETPMNAGRRASSGVNNVNTAPASTAHKSEMAQQAEPEQGVVRNESSLSKFGGHLSDSRVIWHGYLYLLRSKSGLRQWKKSWVVLRPRNVAIYKNDEEYRALKLLSMDNIVNAVEIDAVSRSKKHCMELILDTKSYKFAALNEESLTKWLAAFKSTIAKSKK